MYPSQWIGKPVTYLDGDGFERVAVIIAVEKDSFQVRWEHPREGIIKSWTGPDQISIFASFDFTNWPPVTKFKGDERQRQIDRLKACLQDD